MTERMHTILLLTALINGVLVGVVTSNYHLIIPAVGTLGLIVTCTDEICKAVREQK